MDLRSNLERIIKAANRGANEGRILGDKPKQLGATVLAKGSDSLVLQVLSGHSGRNLKVVPLKAGPSDKGRTRCAPAILAMTVTNALRTKGATKPNGPTKAASLNRDESFNVHRRCRLTTQRPPPETPGRLQESQGQLGGLSRAGIFYARRDLLTRFVFRGIQWRVGCVLP